MIGENYNLGDFLNYLSKKTKNFVVLNSLLKKELNLEEYIKMNEDRFFDFGNAVVSMVSGASGFLARAKTPLVFGYTDLLLGKAYDQIRNDICLHNLNVRIIGVSNGFDNGLKGAAHQFFEEVGLLSCLPNMRVYSPHSLSSFYEMLESSFSFFGPVFFRLPLSLVNEISLEDLDFEKNFSEEIVLLSYGKMTEISKEISDLLKEDGFSVNLVSVQELLPFNIDKFRSLLFAKNVFLIEDQYDTGLFSEILRRLSFYDLKAKIFFLGMQKRFSESGRPDSLYKKYELDSLSLYRKIKEKVV